MIQEEIEARLVAEWGFQSRVTAAGPKLSQGRCPACGEPEAHCYPGNPYVVICPRKNKCGVRTHTRTLYPQLFQDIARHNPSTKQNPTATADAYLNSRGIDPARIAGWYLQGATKDPREPKRAPGAGRGRRYPTVRFTLSNGVAYHRLIGKEGKGKNKIVAAFRGFYWAKPDFDPKLCEGDLWMAEGVLNAVSLELAGCAAAANLSSGHVPTVLLGTEGIRPGAVRVVIAQDADPAGEKSARVLASACRERGIPTAFAFPPKGIDWNDLLLRGDLSPDRARNTLDEALWRGKLFGAESALECFKIWSEKSKRSLFDYRDEYWVGKTGEGGPEVRRIAFFTLDPEVVIARRSGKETEHSLRSKLHNGRGALSLTLSGKELSSVKDFKSAVRTRAWGNWVGNQDDLDKLTTQMDAARPPIVRELEIVGYDVDSDCYFFPDIAYAPTGQSVAPDAKGYFTIGGVAGCFWLNAQDGENPIPRENSDRLPEVMRGLWKAFGPRALAVVGFAAATLFKHQFGARRATRFFPFLSLYGPSGTGKTSMLFLINRLLGRDVEEGIPLNAIDTAKGSTRDIGRISNLPAHLLEMDKAKAARFDMNRLLPLFNFGSLQTRANKSQGLDTHKMGFLGALIFAQNFEQFTGEAQKSRVVSLDFLEKIKGEQLDANKALLGMPFGGLAAFRHEILSHRDDAQKLLFDSYQGFEQRLGRDGVGNARVAQTHAVVMAGVQLAAAYSLPPSESRTMAEAVYPYLLEVAQRKIAGLFAETDYLALFGDTVANMISHDRIRDYSTEESQIWLSMSEIKTVLETDHAQFDFQRIFEELETSGKLLFRNIPKYCGLDQHNRRLYGFAKSLFYP